MTSIVAGVFYNLIFVCNSTKTGRITSKEKDVRSKNDEIVKLRHLSFETNLTSQMLPTLVKALFTLLTILQDLLCNLWLQKHVNLEHFLVQINVKIGKVSFGRVFWHQKNVKNLPGTPLILELPPQRPAKMDLFFTRIYVLFSMPKNGQFRTFLKIC